jgi:hypothetical protein
MVYSWESLIDEVSSPNQFSSNSEQLEPECSTKAICLSSCATHFGLNLQQQHKDFLKKRSITGFMEGFLYRMIVNTTGAANLAILSIVTKMKSVSIGVFNCILIVTTTLETDKTAQIMTVQRIYCV